MRNVVQRRKKPLCHEDKYRFCLEAVREYFSYIGKPELETTWWATPNPSLGGLTPTELALWNLEKLYKFISYAREGCLHGEIFYCEECFKNLSEYV